MKKNKKREITARLTIRVSHELKAAIIKRADDFGLSLPEYLAPSLARLVGQPELKAIPRAKRGRPKSK